MNKQDILSLLPRVIQGDKSLLALAEAVADQLVNQIGAIDTGKIYASIDTLPEPLLDILAKDFKVDWWTQEMSIEDKRRTLKSSWYVHRKLGTKGAVKAALSSVYENSDVAEWFEYEGDPYHFRVLIDAEYESTDIAKYNAVIEQIGVYKNVRSYLDAVEYYNQGVTVTQITGVYPAAWEYKDVCVTANSI